MRDVQLELSDRHLNYKSIIVCLATRSVKLSNMAAAIVVCFVASMIQTSMIQTFSSRQKQRPKLFKRDTYVGQFDVVNASICGSIIGLHECHP